MMNLLKLEKEIKDRGRDSSVQETKTVLHKRNTSTIVLATDDNHKLENRGLFKRITEMKYTNPAQIYRAFRLF